VSLSIVFNLLYFIRTDAKTYSGILLTCGIAKFLLSSILLLILSFTLKGGFLTFFFHFIGHYVLFTVFEMRYLLQLIKTKQK
jgi:predicted membrane protein